MPHRRERYLLPVLLQRTRLWPVLGVLGVRQCGKSVLLRDILAPLIKAGYTTLDSLTQRQRATASPEAFSKPASLPLIIDEIQKAPDLFDAIKLHVDKDRRPKMYVVSGSTEFSALTGVRESLTGRIGLVHLYPLSKSELQAQRLSQYFVKKQPCESVLTLDQIDKIVEKGGMPGICFLRAGQEFEQSMSMWLQTTCYRDIQQIEKGKFEGDLALEILGEVARQSEPSAANVAKKLRRDRRIIDRYLDAFCRIFVLHRLLPHSSGVGKPQYLLCDSGIAHYLGASRETVLRTHLLVEALSTFENAGMGLPKKEYYRNEKSSRIPLVFSWHKTRVSPVSIAVHVFEGEAPKKNDLTPLLAFQQRNNERFRLLLLTNTQSSYPEGKVEVYPLGG